MVRAGRRAAARRALAPWRAGTVLLLSGRTDYIERFHEPVAEWQSRGYAVWMLDWRGQGASQRLLPDPVRNHVESFADYLADADHVLDHAVRLAPKGGQFLLMGHSMGGHLAPICCPGDPACSPAPFSVRR